MSTGRGQGRQDQQHRQRLQLLLHRRQPTSCSSVGSLQTTSVRGASSTLLVCNARTSIGPMSWYEAAGHRWRCACSMYTALWLRFGVPHLRAPQTVLPSKLHTCPSLPSAGPTGRQCLLVIPQVTRSYYERRTPGFNQIPIFTCTLASQHRQPSASTTAVMAAATSNNNDNEQ